jgi:hemerythrin superfamily protein
MTESNEARASHEEVEGFVTKLRDFHDSLSESEQAIMDTVLDSAQGGETGGYQRIRRRSGEDQPEAWQDLVGWIEEQGEDDTQGFVRHR